MGLRIYFYIIFLDICKERAFLNKFNQVMNKQYDLCALNFVEELNFILNLYL